jgi:excisionase family DNA binding protein
MKTQRIITYGGEVTPKNECYSWTVADVARAFSVSRRTVANWQSRKRIPYLKAGKLVRFNPHETISALKKFVINSIN